MPPGDSRDPATIADLIRACEKILLFITNADQKSFSESEQLIDAVSFEIAILGEAVTRLSMDLQTSYPQIPWLNIRNMRNRLIHGYDDIDVAEVWNTAKRDIPLLLEDLRRIQTELFQ